MLKVKKDIICLYQLITDIMIERTLIDEFWHKEIRSCGGCKMDWINIYGLVFILFIMFKI